MIPSKSTIRRSINKLRKIIDSSDDPILRRIAYTSETVLRWTIEDTVGWDRPEKEVVKEAELCKQELRP